MAPRHSIPWGIFSRLISRNILQIKAFYRALILALFRSRTLPSYFFSSSCPSLLLEELSVRNRASQESPMTPMTAMAYDICTPYTGSFIESVHCTAHAFT